MANIFCARCPSRILARPPQNTKHMFVQVQHTLREPQFLQAVIWAVFGIPGVSLRHLVVNFGW